MGIESFREYCHVLAESHRQNIPPSLRQIADEEPKLNEIFGRLGGIWNWLTGKKSDAAAEPEQRDEPAAAPLTGRARRKAQRQRGKFAMGLVRDDDTSPEAEKFRSKWGAKAKLSQDLWPQEMKHHFDSLSIEDQHAVAPQAADPRMGKSSTYRNRAILNRRLADKGIDDPLNRRDMIVQDERARLQRARTSPEAQAAWLRRMDAKASTAAHNEKSRAAFDARRKKDKLDFIDRFVTNFASNFGNADYDPGHPYAAVHPDFVNQALKARGYPELTPEELKMFGKPEGGRKRGAPRGKVEKKDYAPMFGTYDSDDEGIASRPPEPPAPAPRTKRRVEDFL